MMNSIAIFGILLTLMACDPDRLKKCEWYLVPEPDHKHLVSSDWVPLCARNYTTNKQKCYLKAKFDFAEQVYGKAFRYADMELDDSQGRPHRVLGIETCQPSEPIKP